jgi:hypothetical protein
MAWLDRTDRRLVGLTLAVKLSVLVVGALAYTVFAHHQISSVYDGLAIWNRWDAPHYLDLIVFGYRANDPGNLVGPNGYQQVYPGDLGLYIVFYPLFPWLATLVNAILGNPLLSAFAVSTAASLLVAPLLYRLVRHDEEPGVAMRAAWFLLIFPTAYVLHIGYTEALFMVLVLGSFLAARTERWWLAGLLGGLAALTRVNGLVLGLALPAEAYTQWVKRPPGERRLRPEWLAIGLVPIGFAVYLGLNQAVYGDPFFFTIPLREHWYKTLALPWDGVAGVIGYVTGDRGRNLGDSLLYGWAELIAIVIGLAGVVHAALRFRPSWFAWMAGNWLLFISTSFVLSVPRYALTLFPLFVSLALVSRRTWVLALVSAVSIGGLVFFAARFATGPWAF